LGRANPPGERRLGGDASPDQAKLNASNLQVREEGALLGLRERVAVDLQNAARKRLQLFRR